MASEEIEVLSDRSRQVYSEETSETEAIGETEGSSALSGKFHSFNHVF